MARSPVAKPDDTNVTVRVLKMGAGKIATGACGSDDILRDDETGDMSFPTYSFAETFSVARPVAEALEDRGFVEIQ